MDFKKSPKYFFILTFLTVGIVAISIDLGHVRPLWILIGATLFLIFVYFDHYKGGLLRVEGNILIYRFTYFEKKHKLAIFDIQQIKKESRIGPRGGTYPVLAIHYSSKDSSGVIDVLEDRYEEEVLGKLIIKLASLNNSIKVDDIFKKNIEPVLGNSTINFVESDYEKKKSVMLIKSIFVSIAFILTYIIVSELLNK